MAVSPNSKIPYYLQIKSDILNKIKDSVYSPGEQLLSEMKLAEEYEVSRPTVRQAINELVESNVLKRDRGIGTFVSKTIFTEKIKGFKTFEQLKNLKWSKFISSKKIKPSLEVFQDLQLKKKEEILEVSFLKGNEEENLVFRKYQIPSSLTSSISNEELTDMKIYDLLREKHNLVITDTKYIFSSRSATENEAKLLNIKTNAALTIFYVTLYASNKPFLRIETLYRGDRFRFIVDQVTEY